MKQTLALALVFTVTGSAGAAERANTLSAMFQEISACLSPLALAPGTDVTLQFALNRSGGLIGKPRITHAHWADKDDSRKTAQTIADGFDRCLPVAITDALGGAIAGRLIAYRIQGRAPETKT